MDNDRMEAMVDDAMDGLAAWTRPDMMSAVEAREFFRDVIGRCRNLVNALTDDVGDRDSYGSL